MADVFASYDQSILNRCSYYHECKTIVAENVLSLEDQCAYYTYLTIIGNDVLSTFGDQS